MHIHTFKEQKIVAKLGNSFQTLTLPAPEEEIVKGVKWGDHTHLFTPAYWKTLLWFEQENLTIQNHRLGDNIKEEITACLLGGYGIPAEVGLAAFYRLRDFGVLDSVSSEEDIFNLLSTPLAIGEKKIKYRFARQKSKYLSLALEKLSNEKAPEKNDILFRSWLMGFPGISWKTASWVTRNWFDSDQVAIIDIHIHRAGLLMKIYNSTQTPAKNYQEMENSFLDLAGNMSVRASRLDALIWQEMKYAGNMVLHHMRTVCQ
jgi:N-glycosylase/DNA lyase